MRTSRTRNFAGIPVDLLSLSDVFNKLLSWRNDRRGAYIALVNPHSILGCHRDSAFRAAVLNSDCTLPDGVGITVAARLLRYEFSCRLAGPSLMLAVCDWGQKHGLRHFFYGAAGNVAETLAKRLTEQFPELLVAGAFSPPYRELTLRKTLLSWNASTKPTQISCGLASALASRRNGWLVMLAELIRLY